MERNYVNMRYFLRIYKRVTFFVLLFFFIWVFFSFLPYCPYRLLKSIDVAGITGNALIEDLVAFLE